MKIIKTKEELKRNFLELFRNLDQKDIQALLECRSSVIIEKRIKKYCTKEYPLNKVLLIFHAYASIAYITAELKVNSKIFLDETKKDFIILSYKKNSNPDTCSIVFSTIQSLCNHPFFPIPVNDIFNFVEDNNIIEGLNTFYKKYAI